MPIVTVVIPTFNEVNFIGPCLDSLMSQDIGAENIEILVVDGGSTDETRDVVKKYQEKHSVCAVRLLDNPQKYTVYAFNIGITNADPASQYITFLNCHATYSSDRFRRSIEYTVEYGADAVGGRSEAVSRENTFLGQAISLVLRSRFGTGSRFRVETGEPIFADTASGTLYKLSVFRKIALFNEKLICSQDIELNKRLRLAGGKILFVPQLKTEYRSRADMVSFVKHTFRNGVWAILPFKYSEVIPVSLRHMAPGILLVSYLMLLWLVFTDTIPWWLPAGLLLLYLSTVATISIIISLKNRDLKLLPWLVFVFCSFHGIYAAGSLTGVIRCLLPDRRNDSQV